MSVVARIKDTDLLLSGQIKERKPIVTDGLRYFCPFDNNTHLELWDGDVNEVMIANGNIQDKTQTQVDLGPSVTVKFSGEWKKSSDFNGVTSRYFYYLQVDGVWKYHSFVVDSYLVADEWVYIEGSITVNYSGVVTNPKQGVGIRNTATTGQLECRNCHCWVDPILEQNVDLTPQGMWVDEESENLLSSVTYGGSYVDVNVDDGWYKARQLQTAYGFRAYVDLTDLTDGETYTGSVLVYNPNPFDISIHQDWCDQGNTSTTIKAGEEKRIFITNSRTTYDSTYRFYDVYSNDLVEFWLKDFQIEYKGFGTQYIEPDSPRTVGGNLRLPLVFNNEKTFIFKYKSHKHVDTITSQSASPNIFQLGTYYNNASMTFWFYNSASSLFFHIKGDEGSTWQTSGTFKTDAIESWWYDVEHEFAFVMSGTAGWDTVKVYIDGELIKTIPLDPVITSIANDYIGFGPYGGTEPNAVIRNYIEYDRALTADEIGLIYKKSFEVSQIGELKNVEVEEDNGWIKVYEGLCTNFSQNYTYMTDDETINLYGDDYEFDEMKIVAPFWGYEKTQSLTETAKLKWSIKDYTQWLFEQEDTSNPRMKFHGLDDVQDVGFISETQMFWGYGNGWRCITNQFFISNSQYYMYTGQVLPEIVRDDWFTYFSGDTYNYLHHPHHHYDACRESGVHNLTPREFQTICIYIRRTPTKDVPVRVKRTGKFQVDSEIIEDQTLT